MEEGREMYYTASPEQILEAEQNSKIKWQAKCAACMSRAPLTDTKTCKRGFHWHKDNGCIEWRLDPEWEKGIFK